MSQMAEEVKVNDQPLNLLDEQPELPEGQEDYTVTVERDGEVVKVSVEVDGNAKTENAEVTH